jgi:hypothetical protein
MVFTDITIHNTIKKSPVTQPWQIHPMFPNMKNTVKPDIGCSLAELRLALLD